MRSMEEASMATTKASNEMERLALRTQQELPATLAAMEDAALQFDRLGLEIRDSGRRFGLTNPSAAAASLALRGAPFPPDSPPSPAPPPSALSGEGVAATAALSAGQELDSSLRALGEWRGRLESVLAATRDVAVGAGTAVGEAVTDYVGDRSRASRQRKPEEAPPASVAPLPPKSAEQTAASDADAGGGWLGSVRGFAVASLAVSSHTLGAAVSFLPWWRREGEPAQLAAPAAPAPAAAPAATSTPATSPPAIAQPAVALPAPAAAAASLPAPAVAPPPAPLAAPPVSVEEEEEEVSRAARERALQLALALASDAAEEARAATAALRQLFQRATGTAAHASPSQAAGQAAAAAGAARVAESAMRDASAASSSLLVLLRQSRAAGDALTPEMIAALARHSGAGPTFGGVMEPEDEDLYTFEE
jgi:hypothetical protein